MRYRLRKNKESVTLVNWICLTVCKLLKIVLCFGAFEKNGRPILEWQLPILATNKGHLWTLANTSLKLCLRWISLISPCEWARRKTFGGVRRSGWLISVQIPKTGYIKSYCITSWGQLLAILQGNSIYFLSESLSG